MGRIEIRDLTAERDNRDRRGSAEVAVVIVLVHLSEAYVDALAAGPIGGDHHAMAEVALDAERGLIAARKREVGRVNLDALLGEVDVRIRESTAAGRIVGSQNGRHSG